MYKSIITILNVIAQKSGVKQYDQSQIFLPWCYMSVMPMASQITVDSPVCSADCSGSLHRKHQDSQLLAVGGGGDYFSDKYMFIPFDQQNHARGGKRWQKQILYNNRALDWIAFEINSKTCVNSTLTIYARHVWVLFCFNGTPCIVIKQNCNVREHIKLFC